MKLQSTPDSFTDAIVTAYETMEPGDTDAWNPLYSDFQLTMRLSLYYLAREALRMVSGGIPGMQILDIGCGNGRATRMYVDFGFRPDQITGTDLRGNAVASARKLNPAITFLTQDEWVSQPRPAKKYDWISLVTVISSVSTLEHRKFVIEQADAVLKPGGYIFYYDLVNANPFAGGDRIHPEQLFDGFEIIWHPKVNDFKFIPPLQRAHLAATCKNRGDRLWKYWLRRIVGIGKPPSHEAVLVRRKP